MAFGEEGIQQRFGVFFHPAVTQDVFDFIHITVTEEYLQKTQTGENGIGFP